MAITKFKTPTSMKTLMIVTTNTKTTKMHPKATPTSKRRKQTNQQSMKRLLIITICPVKCNFQSKLTKVKAKAIRTPKVCLGADNNQPHTHHLKN